MLVFSWWGAEDAIAQTEPKRGMQFAGDSATFKFKALAPPYLGEKALWGKPQSSSPDRRFLIMSPQGLDSIFKIS